MSFFGTADAPNYVIWGNSMGAGDGVVGLPTRWWSLLAASLGRQIANMCVGGETCPQAKARQIVDYNYTYRTAIYWPCENSPDASVDIPAIAQMKAHQTGYGRYYVVLPCISAGSTANNPATLADRLAIIAAHPNNYIDVPGMLATHGDGSANDNADIANGYIPRSLRAAGDDIHLNATGQALVAAQFQAIIQAGVPPITRPAFSIAGLPVYSAAVRATIAGTSDTHIVFIGNSETAGEGAGESASAHTNGRNHSMPSQVCDNHPVGVSPLIERRAIWGSGNYNATEFALYVPEVTVGAGWATTGSGRLGGPNFANSTTTNALAFAYPAGGFDTVDTYWMVTASAGICSINIDGGTPVTSNLNAANAVRKVTVTGVGLGAHTLNISRSSGGAVNYLGHVLRDSTKKRIYVHNVGAGSSKATDWIQNAAPWQAFPMLNTLAAHLYVIQLGVNDWPATAEATWETQMQTLITQCKLTGDVLLIGSPQRSTNATEQGTFFVGLQNLATANGLNAPVNFKDVLGVYATAVANSDMYDVTHPNTQGYGKEAFVLAPYVFGT